MSTYFQMAGRMCAALLAGIALAQATFAADCGTDGGSIRLESQTEVDGFQATYGAGDTCDRVLGSLQIRGQDITDLSPLAAIRDITGGLYLLGNDALVGLDGLSGLETLGGPLTIDDNPVLETLDGLSGLVTIGAALEIRENAALASLAGLSNVVSVGFSEVEPMCWSIFIVGNASLPGVDGLSGISTTACSVLVEENPALAHLDGLSGLVAVGGSLEIRGNTSLSDIGGLSGVTEVGRGAVVSLSIRDSRVTDVDALSSVEKAGDLHLVHNPLLSDCRGVLTLVDTVDDYEPGPGSGPAPDLERVTSIWDLDSVYSNAPGCNSVDEILAAEPISGINEGLMGAWFNPQSNGQGMFVTVYPRIGEIFLSWFTYDLERPDPSVPSILGDPGHRWLTAQGPYPWQDPDTLSQVYGTAVLDLWRTEGGIFDQGLPEPAWEIDGTLTLEFETCNAATASYDIPSINATGVIPLERIALDNVRRCYELDRIRWGAPGSPE